MNNDTAFKIIEFWKQLQVEIKIEESRYQLYLEKYKTIEASVEYDRSLQLSVVIQNQHSYIKTLYKKQQELVNYLDGFCKTLKDKEGYIFVHTVLYYTQSVEYVSRALNMSVSEVHKIRNKLLEDFKEYWELIPTEPI